MLWPPPPPPPLVIYTDHLKGINYDVFDILYDDMHLPKCHGTDCRDDSGG